MEQNCGSCIYHVPTKSNNPPILTQGKGQGKCAYWVCELTRKGTHSEDGSCCRHYYNKYQTEGALQQWRDKVYEVKVKHHVNVKEIL